MSRNRRQSIRRQRGAALLLIVMAIAALIGIAGLAIDASHVGYMKARLQATVDAMALSAAKRLDQVGTTAAACEAALEVLAANEAQFRELRESHPATVGCPSLPWFAIEYSAQPTPFVPVSGVAPYVRVRLSEVSTGASLARALGFVDLEVAASAIAGPSAPLAYLCSLLPIAVCGTASPPYFGFEPGRVYLLKGKKNDKDAAGFGDFHLLLSNDPAHDNGSTGLRADFAGGFAECRLVGGGTPPLPTVRVKPGANTGPVAQGVNARFDDYTPTGQLDPARYPPDVLTFEPSPVLKVDANGVITQGTKIITQGSQVTNAGGAPMRQTYLSRLEQRSYDIQPLPAPGRGAFLRREVAVPIADCSDTVDPLPIRGAGCFFLMQRMTDGASESRLFGEFISNCEAAGRPGPNPGVGGPYVIQLFRDTRSSDS